MAWVIYFIYSYLKNDFFSFNIHFIQNTIYSSIKRIRSIKSIQILHFVKHITLIDSKLDHALKKGRYPNKLNDNTCFLLFKLFKNFQV